MPWYDLSHPFYEGMNCLSFLPPPRIRTVKDVERDPLNVMEYTFVTHLGTHVDAPRHFVRGGETVDQLALDRLTGPGAVVAVPRRAPEPITAADLEAAGRHVRPGDLLLIHTGWSEKFGTPDYDLHPYLAADAAEWILERRVKFVGVDLVTPDTPVALRPPGFNWPIHRRLLGAGVLIAENLCQLEPLAGRRAQVVAAPIKIAGGDGAPARILATPL